MARKARAFVLDAWTVLAYFQGEAAAGQVRTIIAEAHETGIPLLVSVVNAAEVWYAVARKSTEATADRSLEDLIQLGIELREADLETAIEAAKFKASHKMSLADCFAAALAKQNKADLVTGDPEFRQVESQINIHWL